MSLDVYESEQRISFSRKKPSRFYGFHVSDSDGSTEVHIFNSTKDRARFVREVCGGDMIAAGLLAVSLCGGTEYDREAAALRLCDIRDDADELTERGITWEGDNL